MSVAKNQDITAARCNSAFLSKISDNIMVSKIDLKNPDSAEILELQTWLNALKTLADQNFVTTNANFDKLDLLQGGFQTYVTQTIDADLSVLAFDSTLKANALKVQGGSYTCSNSTYTDQTSCELNTETWDFTAAPHTLATTPFGTDDSIFKDDAIFRIIGLDDIGTVAITHNDIDYGLMLNGDKTLGKGDIVKLHYIEEDKRFYEV